MTRKELIKAIEVQERINQIKGDIAYLNDFYDQFEDTSVEITSRFVSVDIDLDVLIYAINRKKEILATLEQELKDLGVEEE